MPPHGEGDRPPSASAPDPALVPADDEVIGRAFRWSFALLLVLVLLVLSILMVGRRQRANPSRVTPLSPLSGTVADAVAPAARFEDVTVGVGIGFEHDSGAAGEKLLPETMGGGVAFIDLDGDLDPDLLFVNGASWPWESPSKARFTRNGIYRNDAGRFTDVSEGSGLESALPGSMGVACGDFDGDGRLDVLLTGVGQLRLFHNEGACRFRPVGPESGLAAGPFDWSTGAAFVDVDRDGDLDLFVSQYVRWSREIDFKVDYRLVGIGRAYGPPMNFPGAYPRLFRNDGSGRFTDVSAASGIQVRNQATGEAMGKSLGLAPVDFNRDGWLDLIVANDTVQNFVFSNRWDGTFAEVGAQSGLAFDTFGAARGAMGIDAGRFTEDESLGVSIGNFANEMLALYVTQPDTLIFADEAIAQGVGAASRLSLTFGVFFFDYDLDGWLDLLTANGHIENDINRIQASQHYRQPAQLFWNTRGVKPSGGFVPVPPTHVGQDLFQAIVGRGSAFADMDGDGDLDVVITQIDGRPLLLRNEQRLGHGWIRFRLTGSRSNRDAIGAVVKLRSRAHIQWRQVMPTRGYLSQSELPVTFGLGPNPRVDEVEITWPSGIRQRLAPDEIRLGKLNEIREPGY